MTEDLLIMADSIAVTSILWVIGLIVFWPHTAGSVQKMEKDLETCAKNCKHYQERVRELAEGRDEATAMVIKVANQRDNAARELEEAKRDLANLKKKSEESAAKTKKGIEACLSALQSTLSSNFDQPDTPQK